MHYCAKSNQGCCFFSQNDMHMFTNNIYTMYNIKAIKIKGTCKI